MHPHFKYRNRDSRQVPALFETSNTSRFSHRKTWHRFFVARQFAVPVFAIVFLALAGCASEASEPTAGTDPTALAPTVTPTISPTALPSPSPTPAPTASPTAVSAPTTPVATATSAFTAGDISYPACNTGGPGGSGSIGTAVGPTPTPVPNIGSRDPDVASREVATYFAEIEPVIAYLVDSSNEFNLKWLSRQSTDEQVLLLQLLGSRTALACDAVAFVTEVPPEATTFDNQLRDDAKARHAWVGVAVEQILCCGTAVDSGVEAGNVQTLAKLRELSVSAENLQLEYDAQTSEKRSFIDDALGLELSVGEDWLISSEGLSPVLLAPFELNEDGIEGLGPESWALGTSLRIRRLRNPGPLGVVEASARFVGLISRQGDIESVDEIELDGLSALRHQLESASPTWSASVTVFVAGDFTYFIESGCPVSVSGACSSADGIVSSLKLTR